MSEQSDHEQQIDLTKTLLTVFNDWKLDAHDQIALLGLPQDTKPRTLNRYRAGMEVPANPQFLQRAHFILSISNAIDSLYPHNATAANYWITTHSESFGNKSPLDIMLIHGLDGMEYILNLLNGEDSWGH
ncbi:MAG: MbcA/ParS/Xre antitoxin family protein [Gammaproteobacteria bacterium]|jgi:hypothetical protein|nr:MbcA/ParS/Xre antitoxin family protein [Gammaproteobacteria bacterium]